MSPDPSALACAVCGKDRFFVVRRPNESACDLTCTGCGVNTTVFLGADTKSTLTEVRT